MSKGVQSILTPVYPLLFNTPSRGIQQRSIVLSERLASLLCRIWTWFSMPSQVRMDPGRVECLITLLVRVKRKE